MLLSKLLVLYRLIIICALTQVTSSNSFEKNLSYKPKTQIEMCMGNGLKMNANVRDRVYK